MSSFQEAFHAACESGELPGVILLAADKEGIFNYTKAIGLSSTRPEALKRTLELDTVLSIASCTKLMTAIAVLQCAERKLLSLDQDVSNILPELGDVEIITGIEEVTGKPQLKRKTMAISLRQLLSHCSGLCYDAASPLLQKWRTSRGEEIWSGPTIETRCNNPLLFEPGTGWTYGVGTDWAGKMIERATGETLEAYLAKHVWDPLGMKDTTFWPARRSDMQDRMADMSMGDPSGSGKAVPLVGFDIVNGSQDCLGGGGAFSTARDFMVLLQAVLRQDERLLQEDSYGELFAPQLNEKSRMALQKLLDEDEKSNLLYGMNVPVSGQKSWSLGGILSMDEYPGWMGKNTVLWGGLPNIVWFIDREKGLCGFVAPQLITPGDWSIQKLCALFQRGVYQMFASSKVGSDAS